MKSTLLKIDEEQMNHISFLAGVFVDCMGVLFVMIFLEGTIQDLKGLVMCPFCILLKFLEKKLGDWAKYAYMLVPLSASFVEILCNDGKYGAITHLYFFWIVIAIAYYNKKVVLFYGIVSVVGNMILISIFTESFEHLHNLTVWAYIGMVFMISVGVAWVIAERIQQTMALEEQLKSYELELSFMEELEKKDALHREFIHNMTHYFTAIAQLARGEENNQRIVNILQDLKIELQQGGEALYTYYKVVNAVLSQKKIQCEQKGIAYDVYVEPEMKFHMILDGDLVVILGNLLDNAIRAADGCEGDKRKIEVRIFMENNGRIGVFKIKNHYVGQVQRHKLGFVTTKRESGIHGVGLSSVSRLLEKYGGYVEYFTENQIFTVVAILPVKEKSYYENGVSK